MPEASLRASWGQWRGTLFICSTDVDDALRIIRSVIASRCAFDPVSCSCSRVSPRACASCKRPAGTDPRVIVDTALDRTLQIIGVGTMTGPDGL